MTVDATRPLTEQEAGVIEWLRAHTTYPFPPQLTEQMRVTTEHCTCGCASLYFDTPLDGRRYVMLADEILRYPDGQWCGIILWGNHARQVAWLEVYDGLYKVAQRPLDAAHLCRWEDLAA